MSKKDRMTSNGVGGTSAADRKHLRAKATHQAVAVVLDASGSPTRQVACNLRDISAGGACLVMADMPAEGEALLIALVAVADRAPAVLFARVVHVGMMEGEWTRVGIKFVPMPAEAQPAAAELLSGLNARAAQASRETNGPSRT